jgi:hypothetical protein
MANVDLMVLPADKGDMTVTLIPYKKLHLKINALFEVIGS